MFSINIWGNIWFRYQPEIPEEDLESDNEFLEEEEPENVTEYVPPSIASPNYGQHSLVGDDLRQFRKENNFHSDSFNMSDVQRPPPSEPTQPKQILPRTKQLRNLRLQDGRTFATRRMRILDMEESPSQPDTPGDGNCFVHAIVDQAM